MAISFSLILLLATLFTTTLRLISAADTTTPPSPPPSQPTPPPPPLSADHTPPLAEIQENQLKNIIDALIGTGDFAGWANLLSSTDPSSLPVTATLFIPSNDAISTAGTTTGVAFNPFLIPYHIVPQRLTFSDLQQFRTHTRLPTLLPQKYIIVTNNSPSNFTVDDSQIVQADIFVNAAFSVHGIKKVLDYSSYGGGIVLSPPSEETKTSPAEPTAAVEPENRKPGFPGEITVGLRSGASCTCLRSWVSIVFSTFCSGFAIKILGDLHV